MVVINHGRTSFFLADWIGSVKDFLSIDCNQDADINRTSFLNFVTHF
ncbi:hypothetical protein BP354E_5806 [Burkholderia pseudomallei 354e]|nr:hypothetical protein BP354E_5806 [Burkholderia pseudomallei 354e]EIF73031.1 hypothetical protein BP354A_5875 [Burkholderia pseudomallei 354a]